MEETNTATGISAPEERHEPLLKQFLLLSTRNGYKSSASLILALSAVLCCPDIRLLLVSETQKLSKGFIRSFRSYWELSGEPTRFQQLFPEYMIPVGDGSSLTFESPMARLNLIAPTAEASSMESTHAGGRMDILFLDDGISNVTVTTEELRKASVQRHDLLRKLLEVGGIEICLGTPWAATDLYSVLIKRAEEDPDSGWAIRIDPAWRVKEHAKHKPVKDLLEEDVILWFPERLTYAFLRRELKASEPFFLSQNLCVFPPSEDEQFTVNFDENLLRAHIRPAHFYEDFPILGKVQTVDVGLSISRYSDRSCCCVAESRRMGQKIIFVIRYILADRLKQSELARAIVETARDYRPDRITLEKSGAWESLSDGIAMAAMLRNIPMPYVNFAATNIGDRSQINKSARIKSLEAPLASDQLWIVSGGWNDMLLAEMTRYDGKKSSASSKKDDICDAVERAFRIVMPRTDYQPEKTKVDLEEEARVAAVERMRLQHRSMFGTAGPTGWSGRASDLVPNNTPAPTQAEVLRPVDPRSRFLPKGMRI